MWANPLPDPNPLPSAKFCTVLTPTPAKREKEREMEIRNTTLDDVAAVIGFSATLRLSAWYGGGNNLYVPHEMQDDHFLARLLGVSAAQRLSNEWPGEHIAVPRLDGYEQDIRRKVIARMLEQKFGTREIANHLRMSERRVQQITREMEAAGIIDVVKPVEKTDTTPAMISSVFDLGNSSEE